MLILGPILSMQSMNSLTFPHGVTTCLLRRVSGKWSFWEHPVLCTPTLRTPLLRVGMHHVRNPCVQRSSSSVSALLLAAVCVHVHIPQIQVLRLGTPFGAVLHEIPNISPW